MRLDPKYYSPCGNLQRLLARQGRIDEAKAAFQAAIKANPTSSPAYISLAEVLASQDDLSQAAAVYRKAIRFEPKSHGLWTRLARTLERQGQLAEAEAAYRQTIDLAPNPASAQRSLADLLRRQGRFAEAEKVYREVVRLQSNDVRAHSRLIEVLRKQDKIAEADTAFQEANRLIQPDYSSLGWQGYFPAIHGKLAVAGAEFTAVVSEDPHDHSAALRAACLRLVSGDRELYEAMCLNMLKQYHGTQDPMPAHRTSFACLLSVQPVGELAELVRLAEVPIEKGTQYQNTSWWGVLCRGRGLAAYRSGHWQEALKWCAESREALEGKTESVNVDTHDLLIEAMAQHQLGKLPEARQMMDNAATLIRERYPDAPDYLGHAWLDWVIYEVLRKEATAMIDGKSVQ